MIDKLKEYNTCYGHRAPSNWELMEKINELVEEVNRLKRKLLQCVTRICVNMVFGYMTSVSIWEET